MNTDNVTELDINLVPEEVWDMMLWISRWMHLLYASLMKTVS